MLASTFHRPLGLPEPWDVILLFPAGICFLAIFVLQRRSAATAERVHPFSINRAWMFTALAALVAIGGFFAWPYMGPTTLSARQELVVGLATFVLAAGIVWTIYFKRRRQMRLTKR